LADRRSGCFFPKKAIVSLGAAWKTRFPLFLKML